MKELLSGYKFMPEIHLKQPYLLIVLVVHLLKTRIEKFMQTCNTDYIYKSDLDKACLQHNMAYGKYKDSAKRTQSDKVSRDKAFEIASNPKVF